MKRRLVVPTQRAPDGTIARIDLKVRQGAIPV
jgi:hypothetical protein